MNYQPWEKPMGLTMSSAVHEFCKLCGEALANDRCVVGGRLYHPGCIPDAGGWKHAGIEAAYNCILREAIIDLERRDEAMIKAHFDKYRPALDALIAAWPWLRDPKIAVDGEA